MKTNFASHALSALAVAVVVAISTQAQAAESSATISTSTSTSSSVLPDDIQPGTPAAQVIKLVQAGVEASVIQTYVTDCPTAFNLDADKIIALTDAGVPSDMINAMIAHDKNYLASLPMAEQSAPESTEPPPETNAPVASSTAQTSAPPDEVTVNYFYNTLNPYGSWVNVDGYGLCWRPTVVVYNSGWRPYCDRGHWVYTECGWYWDSDYAWGITFHYGRWFNSPRYGWCWWPDTVWGPSWVTWRSSTDYCGWAPLPPFAVYQPGIGFSYRGKNVSVSFGFGLPTSCFTFVSTSHFCEPRPRYYCVPEHQVAHIYSQTAVCNDYNWRNHTICNNGVSVTIIGSAWHHPIQAVPIGSLVNAHRHGWHGQSAWHQARPFGASNADGAKSQHVAGTQYHHENDSHNDFRNREHSENNGDFHTQSPSVNRQDNHNNWNQSVNTGSSSNNHHNLVTYTPTTHNQTEARNNWVPNGGEHRQNGRSYESPTVGNSRAPSIDTTPVRSTRPTVEPTRIVQYTPTRSESPQPTRQYNHERPSSSPTITVGQSYRSDPRQNIVQYTPRHETPNISSSQATVHYQNPAQNGNNGSQRWVAHNP